MLLFGAEQSELRLNLVPGALGEKPCGQCGSRACRARRQLHRKRFRHPLVGDLTLAYEAVELPADPGLTIVTYSAQPGSASETALLELGRWASTRARLAGIGTENEV